MFTRDLVAAKANFDQLLAEVCDPHQSPESRQARIATLLESPGGPFVDSERPMIVSLRNLSRHVTAEELSKRDLPASYIDHDDVTNEAVVVFCVACTKIRNTAKLRSWFWTVMQHRISKLIGGSRPSVHVSDLSLVDLEFQTSMDCVDEERTTDPAKAQAVHLAVSKLSPSLRDVVVLHAIQGHSHEDVARTLGITPASSRVRWHRAKRALAASLAAVLPITT